MTDDELKKMYTGVHKVSWGEVAIILISVCSVLTILTLLITSNLE